MLDVKWERWARATGIVFVVLFIVSFIVYGDAPKVNDSAQKISGFYDDHRGRIFTSDILFGLAFISLLVFVGAIASTLRDVGKGGWGAVVIGSGAVFVAVQAVTGAIAAALALNIAAAADAGTVTGLNTLLWTMDAISAFPLALFILAATSGLARAGIGAAWYSWAGMIAGVLVVLHGTNFATSGFWAPTGGYVIVAILAGLAWALITSIILVRLTPAAAGAPERAAVRTT